MIKLGVNVDHVATVRQARMTSEPDPTTAAALAELGGADIITVHLREDRRHIQDRDVRILRETTQTKLNLEMALSDEIIDIALKIKPDQVTFVPEKREEITTEGGLDIIAQKSIIPQVVRKFKDLGITVSLFIDPDPDQILAAKLAGGDYIELHTGAYANAKPGARRNNMLAALKSAAEHAASTGIKANAGHGLTYNNVIPVVRELDVDELHIGHSIIARSMFVGIKDAVKEMKTIILGAG